MVSFLFFLHKYHPIKMFSRALSVGWRGSVSRFGSPSTPGQEWGGVGTTLLPCLQPLFSSLALSVPFFYSFGDQIETV